MNSSFDKFLAIDCCDWIEAAYNEEIPSSFTPICSLPEGLGYVGHDAVQDIVAVTIRGTKELRDFYVDGEIDLVHSEFGQVHQGFFSDFNLIYPVIKSKLDSSLISRRLPSLMPRIIVTGHSLGAALAVIVHKALRKSLTNLVCYPIATPRIGTDSSVSSLNQGYIYNIGNKHDLVPVSPRGFGYTDFPIHTSLEFEEFFPLAAHKLVNYRGALVNLKV
jgi:predicted lipase